MYSNRIFFQMATVLSLVILAQSVQANGVGILPSLANLQGPGSATSGHDNWQIQEPQAQEITQESQSFIPMNEWATKKINRWSTSNGRCKEIGSIYVNQIRFQTLVRTGLFALFARPRLEPILPNSGIPRWATMWGLLYGLSQVFDWGVELLEVIGKKTNTFSIADTVDNNLRVRTIVDRLQAELEDACDDEYPIEQTAELQ